MLCFRSSYYLALCLLDSIYAYWCVLRFACVHSSANETGLSKKDVKRVRTEEIRHGSLRVSVIFNHSRGFVRHDMKHKVSSQITSGLLIHSRPQRPEETQSKQPKVQQSKCP